jgi:hypothetical protein
VAAPTRRSAASRTTSASGTALRPCMARPNICPPHQAESRHAVVGDRPTCRRRARAGRQRRRSRA